MHSGEAIIIWMLIHSHVQWLKLVGGLQPWFLFTWASSNGFSTWAWLDFLTAWWCLGSPHKNLERESLLKLALEVTVSLLLHVFKLVTKSCSVPRGEKVEPIPWRGVTSLWKRMWDWKYCHNHFWKLRPSTIYKLWSSRNGRDPHILATSGLTANQCGSGAPWVDGLSLGGTLRAGCGPVLLWFLSIVFPLQEMEELQQRIFSHVPCLAPSCKPPTINSVLKS